MHWIILLSYLAGIACAIEAVLATRTSPGAVAWSVSLVSFPFVAVPAYLIFGRTKFQGLKEAYANRLDEIDHLLKNYNNEISALSIDPGDAPSWYRVIKYLSKFELTHSNKIELLIDGQNTFDSITEGLALARNYIQFHFYMIHDDNLGRRIKDILIERSKAGVSVYVLYDEMGSKGLPRQYVRDLQAAGVQVTSFKPRSGWRNFFQLNFRNHRKIVVVDGKVGWVGGHNVGDEYLGLSPKFGPWRDTHIKVTGPSVLQLQLTAVTDWYWAMREIPQLSWHPERAIDSDQASMVLATGPTEQIEAASLFFVSALSAAKSRIWIATPYFIPDEAVLKSLQLAALRGVDVRILTTGLADKWPVFLAGRYYMYELKNLGVRFYAHKPGFLHEKVVLVDDRYSSVGTHNFDNRSFRLNFEVSAIVVDRGFAKEIEEMFLTDFKSSDAIEPEKFGQKPLWWWLLVKVFWLMSPIL